MKTYPSISKEIRSDIYIYAFNKLDGQNFRCEFSEKRGFYKFGSRNQLVDETSSFKEAIELVKSKYENDLRLLFKEYRWKDVICFFEYWGPNSFAGQHDPNDQKTVTLFDVNPYKQGILEPRQFIKYFGHLDIPNVVYEGKVNETFIQNVRNSNVEGIGFEGCVCKGANDKKTKMPIMFKIKTLAWLNKLKEFCNGDENLFFKLE